MNALQKVLVTSVFLFLVYPVVSQTDSLSVQTDSLNSAVLEDHTQKLQELAAQKIADSIEKAALQDQLNSLKTSDNVEKEELLQRLKDIQDKEAQRLNEKTIRINALRSKAKGYPVIGAMSDTLFTIYAKIGATTSQERALTISEKIQELYDDDFLKTDSIVPVKSDNMYDIIYGKKIVMSVSENDAIWYGTSIDKLAEKFTTSIKNSIQVSKAENSTPKLLKRIGLVLLVILLTYFLLWIIKKGFNWFVSFTESNKDKWLKNLSYKDYVFLTKDQEMGVILFMAKIFRWIVYAIILYFTLPIIFSIFPFSRTWANTLFHFVWTPFKGILNAVWNYLPNLFSILVIFFVMKYFIRVVKYFFKEIESGKLTISGFHSDWAKPTYNIVRFLLYAFMFVLIFPYLPGSDSEIFKGVSVFIGILFSLGSTSAIANMVSGLVITYMRPFKIGDRIKIADVTGDVIEKTLLVTRLKTPKNEIITIPNSSVLTGNTINYTIQAEDTGLIIYTTVTIGYDVPWKLMHEVLLEAASRTEYLLKDPKPFVLQTSLDDFYVSYQINAYTKEASKQASIYSNLHQNIQDVCNEKGVEILSPHYRAARDGNMSTIPPNFLPKDYKSPSFNFNVTKEDKSS